MMGRPEWRANARGSFLAQRDERGDLRSTRAEKKGLDKGLILLYILY